MERKGPVVTPSPRFNVPSKGDWRNVDHLSYFLVNQTVCVCVREGSTETTDFGGPGDKASVIKLLTASVVRTPLGLVVRMRLSCGRVL